MKCDRPIDDFHHLVGGKRLVLTRDDALREPTSRLVHGRYHAAAMFRMALTRGGTSPSGCLPAFRLSQSVGHANRKIEATPLTGTLLMV